jgi:MFS family permease
LQVTQTFSLLVSLALAVLTITGTIAPWQILVSVLLNTAAETFDRPARQSLIPALVPKEDLVQAFALLNPSRELAILVGPALAGLLIAVIGPEAMYLTDVASFAVMVVVLQFLRVPVTLSEAKRVSVLANIREGFRWLRGRSLILQLIGLDLSCSLFAAYRALLPALSTDVLGVGASGYGILAAAPSAGALIGAVVLYRMARTTRSGYIILGSTAAYGLAAIMLAQAPAFALALLAAVGLGLFDAMHTTIRHAAIQLEVPDGMRGRVTSSYQIASRGGPALGDLNVGAIASVVGPVMALSIGGLVPIASAAGVMIKGRRVREYQVPQQAPAR